MVRDSLLPVKLLKTLASPPEDLGSGVWAMSPEAGDIETRVVGAGGRKTGGGSDSSRRVIISQSSSGDGNAMMEVGRRKGLKERRMRA